MSSKDAGLDSAKVTLRLRNVLWDLQQHPYPTIPNPPDLKRRASVALIIRINPSYNAWPPKSTAEREISQSDDAGERLNAFFDQDWVKAGTPEVLFIKRASRKGDRWTGHVALPGGRRDPEDEDDLAAAVRETSEEVGIELTKENAIPCGNLPQRLVTTSWGKVPLMILCPYIFLITNNHIPPLRLQPTEIASTHWVPLTSLLTPDMRTYEYQDVTNRLAKQEMGIKRRMYQLMMGKMLFSAVRLIPSESLYCTSSAGYGLEPAEGVVAYENVFRGWVGWARHFTLSTDKPLMLWGLTLGVVADFLEFLPPHNALSLWTYPTFSPPDVRFIIWLMSYNFRKNKATSLDVLHTQSPAIIEVGLDSVPTPRHTRRFSEEAEPGDPPEAGISGQGVGREHEGIPARRRRGSRSSRVGYMLEGYYEIIRRGIAVTLLARTLGVAAVAFAVWRYRGKRRVQ